MAFVVEDGSAKADANAYVTTAFVGSYFDDRFVTTWTGSDGQKQAAVVVATQYLDATYRWRGLKRTSTQRLGWPRVDVYDQDGYLIAADTVPEEVKAATAELALLALSGPLVANVTGDDRISRVKAGSVEIEYEAGAKEAATRYTMVDRLLGTLTASGTGGVSRMTVRGW